VSHRGQGRDRIIRYPDLLHIGISPGTQGAGCRTLEAGIAPEGPITLEYNHRGDFVVEETVISRIEIGFLNEDMFMRAVKVDVLKQDHLRNHGFPSICLTKCEDGQEKP
jgi:hypothetical protein